MAIRRGLAALFLLVGFLLAPLRAAAATIPTFIAYDAAGGAGGATTTTTFGRNEAARAEPNYARTIAYDDALVGYDTPSRPRHARGAGDAHGYDGTLNLADRREAGEGAIFDDSAATIAAEAAPGAYSVAFQTTLDASELGLSRARHFAIANEALADARAASPELAELVPTHAGRASPPSGWVWQHATIEQGGGQAGVMQLVPKAQHTAGSPFWRLLHPLPNGGGGYSEWAIPAGAPPN